jgi:ketosteroid isomerase-like protein
VSDVDVVRRAYAALAAWDLDTLESLFAWDAVWILPGTSAISGIHRGWPEIRDQFILLLGPLSGGTLHADLVDVAVGEKYIVAIQRTSGCLKGRKLDITSCQLVRMRHGLITEVSGLYTAEQLAEIDAFWV